MFGRSIKSMNFMLGNSKSIKGLKITFMFNRRKSSPQYQNTLIKMIHFNLRNFFIVN